MNDLDRAVAAAANRITPILQELGVMWPAGQAAKGPIPATRFVPGVADVVLVLRSMVGDLRPGMTLESAGMAVTWTDDADTGPADQVVFSVIVHTGPAPALPDDQ